MRTAILSDIHGNYEALKSVHRDIKASAVDQIICLGDFVGYGPQPEEVAQFLRNRNIPCVLGNHEYAILDATALFYFNEDARRSIEITKKLISDRTLAFIAGLPVNLVIDHMLFVHGAPPDSFHRYFVTLSERELKARFDQFQQKIAFIGHTHVPLTCSQDGTKFVFENLFCGTIRLNPDVKNVVNVGSVGQPRDGNSDAKYVLFDDEQFTVDLRCVKYNIDQTASLLAEKRFPQFNAERLYQNWMRTLNG